MIIYATLTARNSQRYRPRHIQRISYNVCFIPPEFPLSPLHCVTHNSNGPKNTRTKTPLIVSGLCDGWSVFVAASAGKRAFNYNQLDKRKDRIGWPPSGAAAVSVPAASHSIQLN